jgi:hypothetical protein
MLDCFSAEEFELLLDNAFSFGIVGFTKIPSEFLPRNSFLLFSSYNS